MNNLLVGAVAAEIMLLATLLCVMPVAHLLSHSVPSAAGTSLRRRQFPPCCLPMVGTSGYSVGNPMTFDPRGLHAAWVRRGT